MKHFLEGSAHPLIMTLKRRFVFVTCLIWFNVQTSLKQICDMFLEMSQFVHWHGKNMCFYLLILVTVSFGKKYHYVGK